MKKIIITLALLSALTAGAFGQTMLNTRTYLSYFSLRENDIADSDIVWEASDTELQRFGNLTGTAMVDTPIEFALLSYYSSAVINIRPAQANTILPANNPRLSDQKLGAAVFQEIQVLRFLGDTAAVNRHEAVLQYITGRGNATRAEIETFYRNNIRGLVSQVVDQEFRGITIPTATVTYVKNSLSNFYTTPNQTNFNQLKRIYNVVELLRIYNFSINLADFGRREGWSTATIQESDDLARTTRTDIERILRDLGITFEEAIENYNSNIFWPYTVVLSKLSPILYTEIRK